MQTKMKQIKRTVIDSVPVGYFLVTFEPIWGCSEEEGYSGVFEPDYIAEVDGRIDKITAKNYLELNAIGMTLETNSNPVNGDTHDLRPMLFKTKAEAQEHLDWTLNRFANPAPWQAFVKVS